MSASGHGKQNIWCNRICVLLHVLSPKPSLHPCSEVWDDDERQLVQELTCEPQLRWRGNFLMTEGEAINDPIRG